VRRVLHDIAELREAYLDSTIGDDLVAAARPFVCAVALLGGASLFIIFGGIHG